MREEWTNFAGGKWESDIDVRDFIQKNYTPYEGDESFLAGATEATTTLWDKVMEGVKLENRTHAPVDFDTAVASTITSHDAGYINKQLEKIVGLQTEAPLKRALIPFGGIKMVEGSCKAYNRELDPMLKKIFTEYRKTHNQGVFDVYTPDILRCRKSGVLTGLPDAYGRGRIVGDYRRVALYGIDLLIAMKQDDLANCGYGSMRDNVIRQREELAEQIKAEYAVELSMEEILLLTMFLCYQNEEKTENARPVLIFAFYGVGIASSIAQTVSNMTKLDNIFSYEITSERASAEVYGTLRNFLKKVQQGKGILVIYDSSFLGEMLLEIENELEIPIRQVRVPVTTLGIELARRTLTENDPDKILQSTVESIDGLDCYRKYIVTLCTTGKGGAEELKRYIEKYGQLEDTEVIPMSVTEKELLRDNLKHLMTTGVVQCIVGTYDPGMFAIPFLPISEVFGARKESLPRLLRLEKEAKAKIDYDAMFAYLGEQLTHTDIEKLRKILPDIMKEINSAFMELSLDAEAGLLIHISCCIDRLLAKQEVATNPRKAAILLQYDKEFKKLLKIVKPLEKTFHVIINDDEIANILTIIYQL